MIFYEWLLAFCAGSLTIMKAISKWLRVYTTLLEELDMKKLCLLMTALLFMCFAISAQAAIVERTYAFTGADLINNVFNATARYSADGSMKVYEGMRQIGPAVGTAVGATFLGGNYLTQFNNTWNAAVANGLVLGQFSLSGSNGYAGQWGEDYKPYEWVSGTGPTGWAFTLVTDSAPKSGSYTNLYPVWYNETGGLGLTDANLANAVFTATIKFDTDDMWWGNPNNYLYGANTAPNSLDGLTMYFTSYFFDADGNPVNRYVGNMFGESIPEPASFIVFASGIGWALGFRRLRKK